MAYQYPPMLGNGSAKNYQTNIVFLTRSNKQDATSGYCNSLNGRISAIDFDEVAKDVCAVRDWTGKKLRNLSSVDCFFQTTDGLHYYFIEFKKSTREGFEKWDEGSPPEESFRKKAFDSLALSGMTSLQGVSGKDIMDKAVFIVVYIPSASDSLAAMELNDNLTRLSASNINAVADSIRGMHPVMWNLIELKNKGFYHDVHTWPENDFVNWAVNNLK